MDCQEAKTQSPRRMTYGETTGCPHDPGDIKAMSKFYPLLSK